MAGVPIGLSSLHYVVMDDPDAETYDIENIRQIKGAITANINPNASNETLFADDGPFDTASTIGQIELELSVADIPLEDQATLLGAAPVTNGILENKSTDTPPWVAVGFKSLKSNGKYRYVWLLKGKFQIPEMNHETKADSVNFQPPTIVGTFVKRDRDNKWRRMADEDSTSFTSAVATNWFTDPDYAPVGGGS